MSSVEERVKARMEVIRSEKENDGIENEARRRLKVEKKKMNEKTIRMIGINARLKRISDDIRHEVYAYNRVMALREYIPMNERDAIIPLLENIRDTYYEYMSLYEEKKMELEKLMKGM